jgi:hypothetical protein
LIICSSSSSHNAIREFTSKGYNSEEEIKIPVNLSFAMSGNKVNFEWGFYDTSKFPDPKVE